MACDTIKRTQTLLLSILVHLATFYLCLSQLIVLTKCVGSMGRFAIASVPTIVKVRISWHVTISNDNLQIKISKDMFLLASWTKSKLYSGLFYFDMVGLYHETK